MSFKHNQSVGSCCSLQIGLTLRVHSWFSWLANYCPMWSVVAWGYLLLLNSTGVISLPEPKPTATRRSTGFLPKKQSGPWFGFCFLLNWGFAWKTQVFLKKKIQLYLKFVLESIQVSMRYLEEFFLLCFLKDILRYYVSQFLNIWTEKSLKNGCTHAFCPVLESRPYSFMLASRTVQ